MEHRLFCFVWQNLCHRFLFQLLLKICKKGKAKMCCFSCGEELSFFNTPKGFPKKFLTESDQSQGLSSAFSICTLKFGGGGTRVHGRKYTHSDPTCLFDNDDEGDLDFILEQFLIYSKTEGKGRDCPYPWAPRRVTHP